MASRSFNGSSDLITIGSGFHPANSNFSIAVWVKAAANANTNQRSILCSTDNVGFNFQLGTATGSPSVVELDKANAALIGASTGKVTDGVWTHIGCTWTDATGAWQIYINGSLDASGTTALHLTSTNPYLIGKDPGNGPTFNFYSGKMFDLFVTSTILSAGQFSALAKGSRPPQLGLTSLGYWTLDTVKSPEPDFSGNLNSGTLTGTTAVSESPPVTLLTPKMSQLLTGGGAGSGTVFRRTFSQIGTRTGSRQTMWG